jgi:hypothetical protein
MLCTFGTSPELSAKSNPRMPPMASRALPPEDPIAGGSDLTRSELIGLDSLKTRAIREASDIKDTSKALGIGSSVSYA